MRPKFINLLFILILAGSVGCASRIAHWAVGLERWRSNLEEKTVKVNEFEMSYLEGGQGPSILLVHGFGGDKEHWTRFARKLTADYHVVAVDLPGFGDSSRIEGKSYAPKAQADRLEIFRQTLDLGKVHVVGSSMGGMIAAVYVQDHPESSLSLTLIDSAGIRSPEPSDLSKELQQGRNPLLVEKREDMDRLFNFSFVHPPYIPTAFVEHLYEKSKANFAWNQRIFVEITQAGPLVESALPQIKAPVLVLWGANDRVIHVSSTKVIQKLKPETEVNILPECGHAPMIEKVDESVKIYRDFLVRKFPRVG